MLSVSNLRMLTLTRINLTAAPAGNMEHLDELELLNCAGEISAWLTAAAASISTLFLWNVYVETAIEAPFTKLKTLKLRLVWDTGHMTSLLTQAAPYVTTLDLGMMKYFMNMMDMDKLVEAPFNNLQVLVIRTLKPDDSTIWVCKEIDISGCVLLTRGGTLGEFGSRVKRTWEEEYLTGLRG